MAFRLVLFALLPCFLVADNLTAQPIDIGSRRELFVDDYLIDSMGGAVRLQLHRPIRREIVFKTDAPWEGNASVFNSVFQDGDIYRMYYRGGNYAPDGTVSGWPSCYIESNDGIHWRRPELSTWKSKPSNILHAGGAHEAVFMDTNPDCPPEQKYKMVELQGNPNNDDRAALYWLGSPDGIHFSRISDEPFISTGTWTPRT